MSNNESVLKEYLFFPEMDGYEFYVLLPPRLTFSSAKMGDLPDKHPSVRAVYEFQGRLESGLYVYKFIGVQVL